MPKDEFLVQIQPVFDHVPCGIVVASTSADGKILLVNGEFTAMTGYTLADVPTVEHWLQKAYPDPDYRQYVIGNWERDVSEPGRDVFYRVRCADGADRELLLRAGLLGPERMIVTMLDFSQMRLMQRELLESEQRFQLIAETVDQVFWIHRLNPEAIEYVSPAFADLWGRPVEPLYEDPRHWSEPIIEEDRARVREQWASVLAGERDALDLEYRIRRPDGEIRWIEDRCVSARDESGQAVRMIGIAKDVTDRVRAEEAERELAQRDHFSQKMESLGVLAGGVAHDLNNLLMGVLGNADLLREDLPAGSESLASIEAIELSARRAADLARQLLAYAGRGKFILTRMDLNALVEEMGQLMRASISKKVGLQFEFAEDLPQIEGDPSQIRQVVMNLITNAADSLGEGEGTITLRTGSAEFGRADLEQTLPDSDARPGRYCFLEVSDTGAGMNDETRMRIFDPFYTTKASGRGLGLASVLGIVKGHKGALQVQSEVGRGSTFRALFPGREPTSASGQAECGEPARTPAPRARGCILVVDDEAEVRQVVSRMLGRAGYAVLLAEDGQEAIDTIRADPDRIDACVLDLSMPRVNGLEAHRELRRIAPGLRVLLTSGYSRETVDFRFSDAGLDGFLQKPFTAQELRSSLRDLLALAVQSDEEGA